MCYIVRFPVQGLGMLEGAETWGVGIHGEYAAVEAGLHHLELERLVSGAGP